MSEYYLFLDAMAIQSYIFETNTLKIILGSSLALAAWQERCRDEAGKYDGEVLVAAGGNLLASFSDEAKAREFLAFCRGDEVAPPGLEIAWGLLERRSGEADAALWRRLQVEVARYKAGDREAAAYPARARPQPPGCNFCGLRPAADRIEVADRSTPACGRCSRLYRLVSQDNDNLTGRTLLGRLREFVREELGAAGGFEDELEKLVQLSEKGESRDLLAAVVVDLNNLGDRIREQVASLGFPGLREFSGKLREGLGAALEASLRRLAREQEALAGGRVLRCRPLVAAGDDLVFLLPARFWPGFVSRLLADLRDRGFPACAGVALAKHAFPVNRLVEMAEELCGNAKKMLKSRSSRGCALDWHLHQESVMGGPLAARRRRLVGDFGGDIFVATRKPYTLAEFAELQRGAEEWRTFANRKLHTLYEALVRGPEETRDVLKYVFLRGENPELPYYEVLWERLRRDGEENGSDYPLWMACKEEDKKIYSTALPDELEIKWLGESGREEEQ